MLSYVARMIQGALEQQVFKIKFAFPLSPLGRQKVFSKNFLCLAPMSYTLGMDLVYWTIRMPRLTPFHERRPSMYMWSLAQPGIKTCHWFVQSEQG